ncbi:MAG: site-specific integrase [Deltaproteobacteria bacterium]|nr:site-specific integrase [Deltaproteobacteria bacterium]
MGVIRKRGIAWQIDYVDPIGKRVRKTFKKKKEAEAELGKRVSLMAEGRYLDVKKDYRTTFEELLIKYEENFGNQTSFRTSKKKYVENFKKYFGDESLLANIRYVHVETYRNGLRQKITRKKTLRKDASVNREMSCLHHLFSKGVEWEMLEQSPFDRGRSLLLKENNQRLRFLTEEEIKALLDACPSHLREIVVCAINTGMRKGEILSLKWDQIRNGFIYLEKTKTNEARQIPVNDDLAELFKSIRNRQHLRSEYVFTYVNTGANLKHPAKNRLKLVQEAGTPIDGTKHSFNTALKRSGIKDFRFHDLRHTFASQMILKGASLKDVQEILGHKTMTMTLRYAHLSQEHKRQAINLLNGLTESRCHKMSQNALSATKKGVANLATP